MEARERVQPSNTDPITEKNGPLIIIPLLQLCYLELLTDLIVITVVKSVLWTCALW